MAGSGEDLAVALTILRVVRRWSQSEIAAAAGVTNSAISDYERGKVDPQTQTLQRIMRAFGLPLATLDQTQAFILTVRAQMGIGEEPVDDERALPAAGGTLQAMEERTLRTEIAQVASEGGRFFSRLVFLILELLSRR